LETGSFFTGDFSVVGVEVETGGDLASDLVWAGDFGDGDFDLAFWTSVGVDSGFTLGLRDRSFSLSFFAAAFFSSRYAFIFEDVSSSGLRSSINTPSV
jgi:hypothetical protein